MLFWATDGSYKTELPVLSFNLVRDGQRPLQVLDGEIFRAGRPRARAGVSSCLAPTTPTRYLATPWRSTCFVNKVLDCPCGGRLVQFGSGMLRPIVCPFLVIGDVWALVQFQV